LILGPFSIKFPTVVLKIYQHRKEKSYRGSRESFGNGMTRVTTWEGVDYLVVTNVFFSIALVGWQEGSGRTARPGTSPTGSQVCQKMEDNNSLLCLPFTGQTDNSESSCIIMGWNEKFPESWDDGACEWTGNIFDCLCKRNL
jgi:hypothetical protein